MANTTKNDVSSLIQPGINTLFMENYVEYSKNQDYQKIASIISSNHEAENYSWLTDSPSMREFIGEREIKAVSQNKYSLTNKTWEATLGIERSVLEDENYGQLKMRINDLAYNVVKHKNKLVIDTLVAGNTTKCFDNSNFFANDHTYSGKSDFKGTQSNIGNLPLTYANLKTTISNMRKFKGTNGEPLNIKPTTLVVPMDLEWTAKELVYSSQIDTSNTKNVLQGALEVIVSPYIESPTSWYLLDCSGVMKPLILQERCKVELTSLGGESEEGFMRDLYLFGVRARYNAGYGYWQKAYLNKPN